jgi:DNA-binding ferritin-like protein
MRILSRRWTCLPSSATTTGSWLQTCVRAHDLCDEHDRAASASLLENWIDEAEKRTWFLFEASRAGESPRSDPTLIETD